MIPIPGGEAINDDLNALLRSKKVLEVESQVVSSAHGCCLTKLACCNKASNGLSEN